MIALSFAWLLGVARAQQDDTLLLPNQPVDGTLVNAGATQTWTLNAIREGVYSLLVEREGDLDPVITIVDNVGQPILSNDDYNFPNTRDALLEAITVPDSGVYQVLVSGYEGTTGDYRLTLLPGYARVAAAEPFDVLSDWSFDDALNEQGVDGQMSLDIEGIQERGVAAYAEAGLPDDFYVQVDVTTISSVNSWVVGVALHLQDDNRSYYALEVDARGQWRFIRVEAGEAVPIQNWMTHPAIVPGEIEFTLGVLALEDTYEIFYDGQFIGEAQDATLSGGSLGITLLTANAIGSRVTAQFDNLLVTVPLRADNQPPQQLLPGNNAFVIRQLERQRAIPAGGNFLLNLTDTFLELQTEGATVLPLGRGATFQNFVLGASAQLEVAGVGVAGCGLMFQNTAEDNYVVAYLDNGGGYGLSPRRGDVFDPGIFGENPAWSITDESDLMVVVRDSRMYYYVNGVLVGNLPAETVSGMVGNAALNYAPLSSVCSFDEVWLWDWS